LIYSLLEKIVKKIKFLQKTLSKSQKLTKKLLMLNFKSKYLACCKKKKENLKKIRFRVFFSILKFFDMASHLGLKTISSCVLAKKKIPSYLFFQYVLKNISKNCEKKKSKFE
jgi:hypothetical protein